MLNRFFDNLVDTYRIREVLEVPLYGMTGLTGINSVRFAEKGCRVTLADSKKEWVDEAKRLWEILPVDGSRYEIVRREDLASLPFGDGQFDLVWNFAALWHVSRPERLLSEMARVSSNLVLVFMPNRKQAGYLVRRHILDRGFFRGIDASWAGIGRIRAALEASGCAMAGQGVLDVPPWPDTCFPIGPLLRKAVPGGNGAKPAWTWDIMSYYAGRNRDLKERVERYSFLEDLPLPWRLKALWAHHRYVIFSKNRRERKDVQ